MPGPSSQRASVEPASGQGPRWIILGLALGLLCSTGCSLVNRRADAESEALCRQLSQRGTVAIERGQWDRAETLMLRAVGASPEDAEARRLYAETLWHRRALGQAVSQIEEAIDLAPHDATLLVRCGEMYHAMGRNEDARHRANQAIDLSPKLGSAWALRGRVQQSTGHMEQALADMQHAVACLPNDRELLLQTAELYRQLGRPARALCVLQALRETYRPDEEPQQVFYLEGLALAAMGRFDEAGESFVAALERQPPNAEIYFRLADVQLACGRPEAANEAIGQALSLEPSHAPSLALAQRLTVAARPQMPPETR